MLRNFLQVGESSFSCTLMSDSQEHLMSDCGVPHGLWMFWNIWQISKHNKMKDQVIFLVTNPDLRLVTTCVWVMTFYWNTLPVCWTFWNVGVSETFCTRTQRSILWNVEHSEMSGVRCVRPMSNLVVLHTNTFHVQWDFWSMLGGKVVEWMFERRTLCFGSLRVKTYFGMPKGPKMSLALNELQEIGCSSFTFKQFLIACTASGKKLLLCVQDNQWKILGTNSWQKVPLSEKDDSTVNYFFNTLWPISSCSSLKWSA